MESVQALKSGARSGRNDRGDDTAGGGRIKDVSGISCGR